MASASGGQDHNGNTSIHARLRHRGIYTPLPEGSRCFRLLMLNPGTGDEPLSGQLRIGSLHGDNDDDDDDAGEDDDNGHSRLTYDAVSYVWGDELRDTRSITLNGVVVPIGANLHWALRRLRLQDESRALWADALCINQRDMAERSTQVAVMGLIYSRARWVLACVGSQDVDSGAAAKIAGLLSTYAPAMRSPAGPPEALEQDPRWTALPTLLGKPWFQRAWVLQEVGLARDPWIVYGDATPRSSRAVPDGNEFISYRDLMYVMEWLNTHAADFASKAGLGCLLIHMRWTDWTLHKADEHQYRFLDLLDHGALLGCRDPRDHVYCFLGHPLGRTNDGRPLVVPDYHKTVTQVYEEVSALLIRNAGVRSLCIVEHNEASIKAPSVPSWVIRWNINRVANNIYCHPNDTFAACRHDDNYNNVQPEFVGQDGRVLRVKGVAIDVIQACYRICLRRESRVLYFRRDDRSKSSPSVSLEELIAELENHATPYAYASWPREEHSVPGVANQPVSGGNNRAANLALTLCMGQLEDTDTVLAGETLTLLLGALRSRRGPRAKRRKQEDPPAHVENRIHNLWHCIEAYCDGRCFFVTSNGYYGLADLVTRPGDVCAAVRGSRVPFALRPGQGEWSGMGGKRTTKEARKTVFRRVRLVGEAYVHGFMSGRAIDLLNKGDLMEEAIDIW
ncbi:uncharacterized protein PpBr36_09998 [Pyricularia pennisetigena]|uniref:uncharacterized protein n=1 Tax=Pyricularia pennisetigena TaxID=1578925 RepID=UPI00114FA622|nr:uncharacterized protein PpBr36_09998 [Pyricularia pennisetigena]TLS22422.1 hypothetical protein PpBr36_09998 [Pyricularia pennisetigena]